MKKRNGFVSNSSSSSFIVTFPKKPESKEELAEMMGECHPLGYTRGQDHVINRVWGDLESKLDNPSIIDSVLFPNYDIDLVDDTCDYANKLSDYFVEFVYKNCDYMDRYNGKLQEVDILKLFCKDILQKIEDAENTVNTSTTYTVKFSYSDEGSDGDLEHGDIFRNLEHERISHH